MKSLFLAIALSFVVLPLVGNLAEANRALLGKPCKGIPNECGVPQYYTCGARSPYTGIRKCEEIPNIPN